MLRCWEGKVHAEPPWHLPVPFLTGEATLQAPFRRVRLAVGGRQRWVQGRVWLLPGVLAFNPSLGPHLLTSAHTDWLGLGVHSYRRWPSFHERSWKWWAPCWRRLPSSLACLPPRQHTPSSLPLHMGVGPCPIFRCWPRSGEREGKRTVSCPPAVVTVKHAMLPPCSPVTGLCCLAGLSPAKCRADPLSLPLPGCSQPTVWRGRSRAIPM